MAVVRQIAEDQSLDNKPQHQNCEAGRIHKDNHSSWPGDCRRFAFQQESGDMSQARLLCVNPILPTTDVESSVSYYTGKLGFTVSFRDCSAPENYVGVRRGGVELHLQYQREEDMPKPGTVMIRIVVDDPHALFTEFANRGVFEDPRNLRGTVAEKPWGTLEFALRDLDGHGLTFYRDL